MASRAGTSSESRSRRFLLVLKRKTDAASQACGTILQHEKPAGFAVAVINQALAEDSEDGSSDAASRLGSDYQRVYGLYLGTAAGERAEVQIESAVEAVFRARAETEALAPLALARAAPSRAAHIGAADGVIKAEQQACAAAIAQIDTAFLTTQEQLLETNYKQVNAQFKANPRDAHLAAEAGRLRYELQALRQEGSRSRRYVRACLRGQRDVKRMSPVGEDHEEESLARGSREGRYRRDYIYAGRGY
ncbi:hypothetical protein DMC30DRAFT_25603 [Rhodotorula diobovata]|uniref:Uncharacterized protein n=1 Tax=Rhodotorula diobovata TaxID=5288 RepID=A0A5C5FRR2_9BASI|nr:hypothetical protein DMC30DRAFT_25603 [Rhodotorula diobovata]